MAADRQSGVAFDADDPFTAVEGLNKARKMEAGSFKGSHRF
jgi:hypothetical protein